jgi:serine/threonine protein kinase
MGRGGGEGNVSCLDENTVVEFVQGRLDQGVRRAVEAHVDGCAACRLLLAELARSSMAAPGDEHGLEPRPPSIDRDETGVLTLGGSASVELVVGKILSGRYRVQRMLGRGAVGTVYEVEDQELGERVALKLLRPEVADLPRVLEHLKHEVVLGRRITHPNVCRLHDIGNVKSSRGRRHFITMSLVDGESLTSFLERGAPPPELAHAILLQICDALIPAHEQGVVHRDLKTSNIMIDARAHVTVMDFGLARDLWGEPSQSGMLIGSPAYWSPEQACGERATERSDIYSFGVVACELFGARRPQFGQRLQVSRIPRPYRAVLMRCVETRPEHRFASVGALRRALEAAAAVGTSKPRWLWPAVAAVGLALGGCLAYIAVLMLGSVPGPTQVATRAARDAASATRPEQQPAKPATTMEVALAAARSTSPSDAQVALPRRTTARSTTPRSTTPRRRRAPRANPRPEPALRPTAVPTSTPPPEPPMPAAMDVKPQFTRLHRTEQLRRRRGILMSDLTAYKVEHQNASKALDRADGPAATAALNKMQHLLDQTKIDRAFIRRKLSRLTRLQSAKKSSEQVRQLFAKVHAAYFSGQYQLANAHLNAIFRQLR